MTDGPFVKTISIDYSDDELDALASAFHRPDLARRPERVGGDAVRRAQQQTALRGLVARRAIALSGTASRPRIAFLDPHATMLGAYLSAPVLVTIRREEAVQARSVSLFVHGEVVVQQEALPGQALQRMTAYGAGGADALLAAELELPQGTGPSGATPIEMTRRMITGAVEAFDRREPAPDCVPADGADLLYARVASGSVAITARDRSGTVGAQKWAWIDGGTLGLWQVHTDEASPMVRFVPADGAALQREIMIAWGDALDAAPIATRPSNLTAPGNPA